MRAAILATLVAAAGCDREPPPTVVIAGIGVPESAIASLGSAERQMYADLLSLGAAIVREESEELGRPLFERTARERLAAALPYALAVESLGWTEQDLRAAYAEQPEWELVVRHVVRLADSDTPPEARARARQVAEQVARRAALGEDFAALAAEYSEEPGAAERGGLLEPGRRGSWVDSFWNAASILAPGQTTGVVESIYGFHVIRLDDRRPIPLEEASRTALLERVVPGAAATAAIDAWAADAGRVTVDPEAAALARERLLAAEPLTADLVIATSTGGVAYTGEHLVAAWGLLDPASRGRLEAADLDVFREWIAVDANVVIRGIVAERMGLDLPQDAFAAARTTWFLRVGGWAGGLGFRPGMSDDELLAATRNALLSGTPEARAARADLRSLRPRLRTVYPVVGEL